MGIIDDLFGTGETGGDKSGEQNWSAPVHGTMDNGDKVTASFGKGKREGETLLSDGHKGSDFYGSRGNKGHDHYDGEGGGTNRGQYTGPGS